MTILVDIQNAQSLRLTPFVNKHLLIKLPLTIIEQVNPPTKHLWLFDTTNYGDSSDYVYLTLFPQYTPEDDTFGDKGYKNTFSRSAVAPPSLLRRGFTASVTQSQRWIFDLVERLVRISNTSSFTVHTPIKIIDFCRPEGADTFTTRYGKIDITRNPSFISGADGLDYCLSLWEFKFSEAILRII